NVAEFHAADLANIEDDDARAARLSELVAERNEEIATLLADLGTLPETPRRIAELREEAQRLLASVPTDFQDILSAAEIDLVAPPAEVADQLGRAIAMEQQANALGERVNEAYQEIGRIGLQPVSSR